MEGNGKGERLTREKKGESLGRDGDAWFGACIYFFFFLPAGLISPFHCAMFLFPFDV